MGHRYQRAITALASLPTFHDIEGQIARREWGFGSQYAAMRPLKGSFQAEGEMERFRELVRELAVELQQPSQAPGAGAGQ